MVVADPELLADTANDGWALPSGSRNGSPGRDGRPALDDRTVRCLPVALTDTNTPGRLNPENAGYVLETLKLAAESVLRGDAAALVTAPVHKGVINDAGHAFSGHTEFLAALAGVERVVMMLVADRLRVALATTHLPLRNVPDAITREGLRRP